MHVYSKTENSYLHQNKTNHSLQLEYEWLLYSLFVGVAVDDGGPAV